MGDQLEYPLAGKGVFVIVKLCRHKFSAPWDKLEELNYKLDQKSLMATFNLDESSPNVLLAEDLTSEPGENNFDNFMDTFKKQLVAKDPSNEEPSFVIFTLLSHGMVNGGILLATPDGKTNVEPCNCNLYRHTGDSQCYVRYISKHLMFKVNQEYGSSDIPKIFLIQTCRGDERNVTNRDSADGPLSQSYFDQPPSEVELFILKSPNCFLFRPCVEGNGSWAGNSHSNMGSFFITQLCYVLNELRKSANESAQGVKKLAQMKRHERLSQPFDNILRLLCPENIDGGWLVNVCQRTTSLVSNDMVKCVEKSGEKPVDKQQPHFSSSLAYKVSCLKILKTQWDDDEYLTEWYDQIQEGKMSTAMEVSDD